MYFGVRQKKIIIKNMLESDPLGVNGLCNGIHLFGLLCTGIGE